MQRTALKRPPSLDDFIGQKKLVNLLTVSLVSSIKRGDALPHIMMAGPPGLGKTTLAAILAHERGVPVSSFLATSITSDRDIDSLFSDVSLQGYTEKGEIVDPFQTKPMVIFIDEIHRLKS